MRFVGGARAFGYPTVFGPTSVPGCQFWGMVDDGSVYTTVTGGNVAQLNDRTAYARHAAQATAGDRPTHNATTAALNNRPSMSHASGGTSGIGRFLDTASWSVAPATPFAIAVVGVKDADFSVFRIAADSVTATQARGTILCADTTGYMGLYASGSTIQSTQVPTTFVALAQFRGNGQTSLYYNNVTTPILTGDAGTSVGTGYALRIGAHADSNPSCWSGQIAFVGVWQGLLSKAARAHIMRDRATSLGPYYGITVT